MATLMNNLMVLLSQASPFLQFYMISTWRISNKQQANTPNVLSLVVLQLDDTCKLKNYYAQEFTDHINSLDPDIKLITEGDENKTLDFLGTLSVIQLMVLLKSKL